MMIIMGNARIQHADTGVVYEIDRDLLDFRTVEMHENEMKNEMRYLAELEHPELGKLTWELREYPSGLETHHATNVSPHKLLEDIIFKYIDDKSDKNNTRKIKTDAMVEWFHKNYEDPNNELPYDKDGEYGFAWVYGGPCDASEELQDNFPDEDYDIIEAAVEKIQSDGMVAWSPIAGPEFFGEEPPSDDEIAEINSTLDTLIDTAPEPKTDPAFALDDNNLLYITDPPDNQPVDNQNDLLNELRAITDDLLQSLDGTNAHQPLERVVKQYKEAISGNQISISRLYGRGIRLDKIAQIIKRGIAEKELPSLPTNTETHLESALEIHGTYIMSNPEGQILVRASVAYSQPPEQTEVLKTAGEQFANSIVEKPDLFGEDVREHFSDFSSNIGNGQHLERSNQISGNTVSNFVLGVLKNIKSFGVMVISGVVGGVVATTDIGIATITTSAEYINVFCSFLTNSIPSLQVIATFFAEQLPWLVEAVQFLGRIASMIVL
ncbi:MAG: hypothetical protein ACNYPD_07300 [Candidatus Halichondribacter symbioticus]